MRHLVPRLLECQLLVMEPFIAGPLQALDRLQRCLKCEGLDAFERLLRYQTICFQSTEADATGRLGIAEVAAALIAYHSGPRVLCQQFGTAMATAQDPGQQRTAAPNRSTHDISFRIRIVGEQRLIVLVRCPTDVALVVIGN